MKPGMTRLTDKNKIHSAVKDRMLETAAITTGNQTSFTTARRINKALTASVEKRVLQWLASHAPRWVSSDQLTLLGFVAQLCAGICYGASRYDRRYLLLVSGCVVLNWLGDSLDGTLARTRQQQRPRYGFYVDHMVDILGSVALMGGLGYSGFLHWQTAMAMLVGFLLLSSESYLATYTLSCFQLSQGLFGPTEIRIGLIVGNLALLRSPYATVVGHRFLLFDLGGTIAAMCMFAMTLVVTLRHTRQLYRMEPLS